MRRRTLLFGLAVTSVTFGSVCDFASSQEDGKQGPPGGERGGPGGGDRSRGGPGGFPGRGGGGILTLLRMEEVQKELALEDSQKKDIEAAGERVRASFTGFAPPGGGRPDRGGPQGGGGTRPDRGPGGTPSEEQMKEMQAMMTRIAEARTKAESEVMLILDPIQQDRILGLLIQAEDGRSLISSQALCEVLGIDTNQKERLKAVSEKSTNELREMATKAREAGGGPTSEMMEQMQALGKKVNTELLAVMTPEQKSKYEALKGEKFTFPENRGFGGPGGPGGGNRGNGGPGGGTRGSGGPNRDGGRPARPE